MQVAVTGGGEVDNGSTSPTLPLSIVYNVTATAADNATLSWPGPSRSMGSAPGHAAALRVLAELEALHPLALDAHPHLSATIDTRAAGTTATSTRSSA